MSWPILILITFGVLNYVSANVSPVCSHLLACIPVASCEERHRDAGSDVLESMLVFKCGPLDAGTVCCPAVPQSNKDKQNKLLSQCMTATGSRIANAETALLGEFPWMALIGMRERGKPIHYLCGGSLITNRYVLTAAHCVIEDSMSKVVQVRLGAHDLRNTTSCEETFPNYIRCVSTTDVLVSRIMKHPRYNSSSFKHDIALIRLRNTVKFEEDVIGPICLPFTVTDKYETQYRVAGWGKTGGRRRRSNLLLKARVSSIFIENCNTFKHQLANDGSQLCVSSDNTGVACRGDSGGPLFTIPQGSRNYTIFGIVSFGRGQKACDATDSATIYTRVKHYLNWIIDNIEI